MKLFKDFCYGLLPYVIVGVLTALIFRFNIIHTLVVVIVMVGFNIAINTLKHMVSSQAFKDLMNGTGSKK